MGETEPHENPANSATSSGQVPASETGTEADRNPGGSALRSSKTWWHSAVAALVQAVSAVPGAMANGAIAGVNPIHGLYGAFVGPIVGGLLISSELVIVTTTGAAALTAHSAVINVSPEARLPAMIVLTMLTGILMVVAGGARLSRLLVFVSRSVMTGFLTGVSLSILLGQIPGLLGAVGHGSKAILRAFDVLTHPQRIHVPSMVVGAVAIVLLIVAARTPIRRYGSLLVLVSMSVLVNRVPSLRDVAVIADIGRIRPGMPPFNLPHATLVTLDIITGAVALVAVVLIQGAGAAEASPNPDGSPIDMDRDFRAQGFANMASAVVGGIPVGGSLGATAVNRSSGATNRWVGVISGLWMLLVLLLLSGLAEKAAVPALSAILVVGSIGALGLKEVRAVWRGGGLSRVGMVVTLVGTLTLPLAAAVGIGMVISAFLAIGQEAHDIKIVQIVDREGLLVEEPPPAQLVSHSTVLLAVYGSLIYAGARRAEAQLPKVGDSVGARVVIRMRGAFRVSSTAMSILERYASELHAAGGTLILSGVGSHLYADLRRRHHPEGDNVIEISMAGPVIGWSTMEAVMDRGDTLLMLGDEPKGVAFNPGDRPPAIGTEGDGAKSPPEAGDEDPDHRS